MLLSPLFILANAGFVAEGIAADAIVLLGNDEPIEWRHTDGRPVEWLVEDGVMTVVGGTGDIETVRSFADVQLHIEWRAPVPVEGESQGRGNSSISRS